MNNDQQPIDPIEALMHEYFDGQISADGLAELERVLMKDSDQRAKFRALATVEEGLADLAAAAPISLATTSRNQSLDIVSTLSSAEDKRTSHEPHQVSTAKQKENLFTRWLPWMLVTAAAIYLMVDRFGTGQQAVDPNPGNAVADRDPGKSQNTYAAVLVDRSGARFADSANDARQTFSSGRYSLVGGKIHLRFTNGADAYVQSPADFEIINSMELRLHDGKLRAVVPEAARGFTVVTKDVDFEDLGTEFGVAVDSKLGTSQLHVFQGHVDVKKQQTTIKSVFDGTTVSYRNGDSADVEPIDFDQFPAPGTMGMERWKARQLEIQNDPDVIAFFPFLENQYQNLANLANDASDESPMVTDGQINAARWTAGRWPGKSALLFERDTDYVDLEISGPQTELSFSAWVKVDSLDHSHISILNSNGWSPGDLHWQLRRTGTAWLAPHDAKFVAHGKPIPQGEWANVAATISLKTRTSKSYLNGELQSVTTFDESIKLDPGKCRIGNWKVESDWGRTPTRNFHGRMDELIIWRRSLSDNEVKEQFEVGRPVP